MGVVYQAQRPLSDRRRVEEGPQGAASKKKKVPFLATLSGVGGGRPVGASRWLARAEHAARTVRANRRLAPTGALCAGLA